MSNTSPLSQNSIASSKRPTDFTFCDIPRGKHHQKHHENENPFAFSPPLWSKNVLSTSSDHIYQFPSPANIMAEGRKELMELMPELCDELSLKDIVVKDSNKSRFLMKDQKIDTKPDIKGKKKGTKNLPISRSVSLDTGVYILKMFVPSSLGSKKQHKVSRSKSIGGSTKHSVDVEKRKIWFFVRNKKVSSGLGNDSSSCTTANKKGYGDGSLKPTNGCLFTSKPTNRMGCIFFRFKMDN